MDDAELLNIVKEFRDGILGNTSSSMMCFAVSAPLQSYLSICGVTVKLQTIDLNRHRNCLNHSFLIMEDGRVLDPTADQFNCDGVEVFPEVYLGEPKYIHKEN